MSSIHTALYSHYKDSQYGIDDKKTHKLYISWFDHGAVHMLLLNIYSIILIWMSLRIDRLTTTFWQHGKPNDTPPVRIAIQRGSPTYLGKMIATSGINDDVTFLFGKFIPQTYLGCWEQLGIAINFLLNQVNPNNMSNDLAFFWRFVSLPAGNNLLPMVAIRGGVGASQADPSSPMTLPLWVGFQAIHELSTDRCHGYMGGIL